MKFGCRTKVMIATAMVVFTLYLVCAVGTDALPFVALAALQFAATAIWARRAQKANAETTQLRLSAVRNTSVPTPAPPALPAIARESLCDVCSFSRTVRGYEAGDVLVTCAYAFPPQNIPFPVRKCTDFKAKRLTQIEVNGGSMTADEQESFAAMAARN
jgi:hypothetical protein